MAVLPRVDGTHVVSVAPRLCRALALQNSGTSRKRHSLVRTYTYTPYLPFRRIMFSFCPRAVNACTNHRRIPVQGGTAFADVLSTVLVGEDWSVVLAGYTTGSWVDSNAGEEDYLVVKLDSDGNEVWVWQVRDRQNRPDLRRAFFVVSRLCIA